jgi:spore maturation protein CgeB
MRIFLALSRSPNPSFTSDIWKANLHDPLVAMGHDVVLWDDGGLALFDLDPEADSTGAPRLRYTEGFLRAVESAHRARPLDLVLTYLSSSHLEPAAIRQVKERIAPIVNFFCNNVHQFHLVRAIAPAFDLSLVPEAEALDKYRRAGAEPFFWPMAANPALYHPVETPVRYDATFAGQRYGDRTSAILALREKGVDAHAFGQHWAPDSGGAGVGGAAPGAAAGRPSSPGIARAIELLLRGRNPFRAARDVRDWTRLRERHKTALHGPVSDRGYVSLFSESRISLGFLVLGDSHRTFRPLRQIRLREFEAPMAGAFYLTGWLPEIALHYEVGKEIVCYRSSDELVDLARYYLAHETERERIRLAGQVRALRDHTWERRYASLFEELRRRGLLRRGATAAT